MVDITIVIGVYIELFVSQPITMGPHPVIRVTINMINHHHHHRTCNNQRHHRYH